MANPQIEDGHLDLANEIVESLAKIRISGEESQVLWAILRKTYGWHKKEDKISLSQFSRITGLKKQAVHRALFKLSSKKMIVIKKDDSQIRLYSFNKDFDKWEPSSKKITVKKPSSILIKAVIKKDDKPSTKMMNTKEKKETITKEIYISAFLDFWKIYPTRKGRKVGKKKTKERFKQIKAEEISLILGATKNYAESTQAKDGYAKDPERFLKDDYWRDWILPSEKEKTPTSPLWTGHEK